MSCRYFISLYIEKLFFFTEIYPYKQNQPPCKTTPPVHRQLNEYSAGNIPKDFIIRIARAILYTLQILFCINVYVYKCFVYIFYIISTMLDAFPDGNVEKFVKSWQLGLCVVCVFILRYPYAWYNCV